MDLDSAAVPGVGAVPAGGLLQEQHGALLGGGDAGAAAARHQRELRLLADLPLLLPPGHRRRHAARSRTSGASATSTFTYKRKIRYHSPRYVVDLVKYARERFGIDFIGFLDENLMTMHQFSGKTWLTDIARLWIEEGLQPQCVRDDVPHDPDRAPACTGAARATPRSARPRCCRAIKQAGCSHLVYGYESFSPRVMKTIGKGATPETNERSLRWTLEAGIRPIPNQMMGFPDEDFDSHPRQRAAPGTGSACRSSRSSRRRIPGTEWYYANKEPHPRAVRRRPRSLPARPRRRHARHRGHLQEVQRGRALRAARADGAARPRPHRRATRRSGTACTPTDPLVAKAGPASHAGDHVMKIAILGLGSIGRRHLGNFHSSASRR